MTSPLVSNVRSSDPRNAQVSKRSSLWFCALGLDPTVDSNWKEFGSLVSPSLTPMQTFLEHYANRRGAKTRDRIEISEVKAQMKFKIDEINTPNLQKAFGSSMAKTTGSVTVRDGAIYANPGGTGVITIPPGSFSSLVVRSTNEEGVQTTYVAGGTDYTVDLTAGTVTIANTGALANATTVPEVEIQWAKSVNTELAQIFDGTPIRGKAQFQMLTASGARIVVQLNNVVLENQGDIVFGDGSAWMEIGFQMECLADQTGSLGYIHVVDAAATF